MPDIQTLTEVQRDALREVANIGAGHAATALSLMTETKIMVSVPTITVVPVTSLAALVTADSGGGGGDPVAVIAMDMSGSMHGSTILLLPLGTARRLATLVLRRVPAAVTGLDSLETSALSEAGNILVGAYMTALSEFLQMQLLPSPPRFVVGPAEQTLMDELAPAGLDRYVFCVETQFMIEHVDDQLRGYFLLLPDAGALASMLAAVRVG